MAYSGPIIEPGKFVRMTRDLNPSEDFQHASMLLFWRPPKGTIMQAAVTDPYEGVISIVKAPDGLEFFTQLGVGKYLSMRDVEEVET